VGGVNLFQTRGQFLSVWECSLILSEKVLNLSLLFLTLLALSRLQIVGVAIPIILVVK
jgi:hypothetical protein